MLQWPTKDPDEVLDYAIDWAPRLNGDTIATSQWMVPEGITAGDELSTASTATIWLSGGTDKTGYILTNRITTAGGRTMDYSVRLLVKSH